MSNASPQPIPHVELYVCCVCVCARALTPTKVKLCGEMLLLLFFSGGDWREQIFVGICCLMLLFRLATFHFILLCFVSFHFRMRNWWFTKAKKNAKNRITETFRLFNIYSWATVPFYFLFVFSLLLFYLFSMISFICLTWLFRLGFNEYVNALVVLLVWRLTSNFPQPFSCTARAAVTTENMKTELWNRLTMFDAHCTEHHSIIGYLGVLFVVATAAAFRLYWVLQCTLDMCTTLTRISGWMNITSNSIICLVMVKKLIEGRK